MVKSCTRSQSLVNRQLHNAFMKEHSNKLLEFSQKDIFPDESNFFVFEIMGREIL